MVDFIESLDLTSNAERQVYTAIMQNTSVLDQYFTVVEKGTVAITDATSTLATSILDLSNARQRVLSAFGNSLSDAIGSVFNAINYVPTDSAISDAKDAEYEAQLAQYNTAKSANEAAVAQYQSAQQQYEEAVKAQQSIQDFMNGLFGKDSNGNLTPAEAAKRLASANKDTYKQSADDYLKIMKSTSANSAEYAIAQANVLARGYALIDSLAMDAPAVVESLNIAEPVKSLGDSAGTISTEIVPNLAESLNRFSDTISTMIDSIGDSQLVYRQVLQEVSKQSSDTSVAVAMMQLAFERANLPDVADTVDASVGSIVTALMMLGDAQRANSVTGNLNEVTTAMIDLGQGALAGTLLNSIYSVNDALVRAGTPQLSASIADVMSSVRNSIEETGDSRYAYAVASTMDYIQSQLDRLSDPSVYAGVNSYVNGFTNNLIDISSALSDLGQDSLRGVMLESIYSVNNALINAGTPQLSASIADVMASVRNSIEETGDSRYAYAVASTMDYIQSQLDRLSDPSVYAGVSAFVNGMISAVSSLGSNVNQSVSNVIGNGDFLTNIANPYPVPPTPTVPRTPGTSSPAVPVMPEDNAYQVYFDSLTTTEKMVEQAYKQVLNRSAETEGLNYWANELSSGKLNVADLGTTIANAAANANVHDIINSGWAQRNSQWLSDHGISDVNAYLLSMVNSGRNYLGLEEVDLYQDYVNALTTTEKMVEQAYKQVLNRSAETEGLNYWANELSSGRLNVADLRTTIANAAANANVHDIINSGWAQRNSQWLSDHGISDVNAYLLSMVNSGRNYLGLEEIPAFAAGGYHTGGVRLVGENGPELEVTGASRIFNTQQTQNILRGATSQSSGNNDALLAEIRALRLEIKAQNAVIESMKNETKDQTKVLKGWDYRGMPQQRATA